MLSRGIYSNPPYCPKIFTPILNVVPRYLLPPSMLSLGIYSHPPCYPMIFFPPSMLCLGISSHPPCCPKISNLTLHVVQGYLLPCTLHVVPMCLLSPYMLSQGIYPHPPSCPINIMHLNNSRWNKFKVDKFTFKYVHMYSVHIHIV